MEEIIKRPLDVSPSLCIMLIFHTFFGSVVSHHRGNVDAHVCSLCFVDCGLWVSIPPFHLCCAVWSSCSAQFSLRATWSSRCEPEPEGFAQRLWVKHSSQCLKLHSRNECCPWQAGFGLTRHIFYLRRTTSCRPTGDGEFPKLNRARNSFTPPSLKWLPMAESQPLWRYRLHGARLVSYLTRCLSYVLWCTLCFCSDWLTARSSSSYTLPVDVFSGLTKFLNVFESIECSTPLPLSHSHSTWRSV